MRSMTGFGAGSAPLGTSRVMVEVRSVNARSLDVRTKIPDLFADATLWVEQLVRSSLRRGRVEVAISFEAVGEGAFELDRARAVAAMRAFADVGRELGLTEPPPLSLLATVPSLFGGTQRSIDARTAAKEALGIALADLDRDRAREGAAIAAELVGRADAVLVALGRAASRAGALPQALRARLHDRLSRLALSGLDPARLEAEVAILADRADVAEELSRLSTHITHFRTIASSLRGSAASSEPEGRRLDFLLQEALREATTLSVKAQDADVSKDVVEMKVELERMREQVQNVE
ncbi:MAG: YicC family protein [Polyangiaceae bacterium]|nr:YicC family protein [Polyangiaceae bacterium]